MYDIKRGFPAQGGPEKIHVYPWYMMRLTLSVLHQLLPEMRFTQGRCFCWQGTSALPETAQRYRHCRPSLRMCRQISTRTHESEHYRIRENDITSARNAMFQNRITAEIYPFPSIPRERNQTAECKAGLKFTTRFRHVARSISAKQRNTQRLHMKFRECHPSGGHDLTVVRGPPPPRELPLSKKRGESCACALTESGRSGRRPE